MKSKDVQKLVFSKFKNGKKPQQIFGDLSGIVCLKTIQRWCKMIGEIGSIKLSKSPGHPRSVRTKEVIKKVKGLLKQKKRVTTRKLASELAISKTTMSRILKNDLRLKCYKKIIQPLLSNAHKAKRIKFGNWARNHYRKSDTMRILFSDEKMFDLNGAYNSQNDRIWAVNRVEASKKGGIKRNVKFPQKVMVWLGACSKGVTPLVILDKGTVDHERYIKKVLPVALKYGNKMFGDQWTFQQDGAKAHTHHLSQQWCRDNFPDFIVAGRWPPNSPDLNPLDYSVWEELVQAMTWRRVKSKSSLISEIKRGVKRMRQEVILESCKAWTVRVENVCKNGGNYFGK